MSSVACPTLPLPVVYCRLPAVCWVWFWPNAAGFPARETKCGEIAVRRTLACVILRGYVMQRTWSTCTDIATSRPSQTAQPATRSATQPPSAQGVRLNTPPSFYGSGQGRHRQSESIHTSPTSCFDDQKLFVFYLWLVFLLFISISSAARRQNVSSVPVCTGGRSCQSTSTSSLYSMRYRPILNCAWFSVGVCWWPIAVSFTMHTLKRHDCWRKRTRTAVVWASRLEFLKGCSTPGTFPRGQEVQGHQ